MTDNAPDDDLPWNEAQWEEFLKESETRAAKFGELLETLLDHPDRDAIIEREMGWDRDDEEEGDMDDEFADELFAESDDNGEAELAEEDEEELDFELDAAFDIADVIDEIAAAKSDEEVEGILADRKEALRGNAAYQRSFAYGRAVLKALKPWLRDDEPNVPIDDDIMTAFGQALVIAAKLAGAHSMGTDDDVLCGNIVCCRRALEAAQDTLRALESLHDRNVAPADVLRPLVDEGRAVFQQIEAHIADLRERVWWQ
jgi:hypothetical protein